MKSQLRASGDGNRAGARVFGPTGKPQTDYWQEYSAFFGAIQRTGASDDCLPGPPSWKRREHRAKVSKDCGEFVERSIDRWGQQNGRFRFWSIGDEPNSPCANGGLTLTSIATSMK